MGSEMCIRDSFGNGQIIQADRFLVRERDVYGVQNPTDVPVEVLDIDLCHGSITGRGAMNSSPLALTHVASSKALKMIDIICRRGKMSLVT